MVLFGATEERLKQLSRLAFIVSIFLSAFLLFLIQPIIGRVLLTLYGGTPAVWNTCMVCFQALLMAGYAYAHWSLDALGPRRQAVLHTALLIISLFVLPFTLPVLSGSIESPVLSIIAALLLTIGLPFGLLASNSSLVQRWYSLSQSGDPFALYAVSNGGSLLALLGYPLLFEPAFGLSMGWRVWAGLYLCFLGASVLCIVLLSRAQRGKQIQPAGEQTDEDVAAPDRHQRLAWTFRAAVASSLLLSVTMKITTDVASAPILWAIPLSLYLITFIIAFSPGIRIPRKITATFTAIGIAWALATFLYAFSLPIWLTLGLFLSLVFFGCLLCHADLADARPSPRYLTQFYLWLSIGGALGGIFNSLVAPLVFNSLLELPITLLALAFLIHARGGYLSRFPMPRMRSAGTYMPAITVIATLCVTAALIYRARGTHLVAVGSSNIYTDLMFLIPLGMVLFGLVLARHAGQFEIVILCLLIYAVAGFHGSDKVVAEERSFFGIMRVIDTRSARVFVHGTTLHGSQWRDSERSLSLSSYYHPSGPFGDVLPTRTARAEVGVVGLGVGSLAALGEPGQTITFFEIDPMVETLARRHFTYLRDARAKTIVQIGDGRLFLQQVPDQAFELLILDAFSSDAIPTHLLTREALNLYLRKVKPGGVVMAHISNRHVDMTRVFRAWSAAEQLPVVLFIYEPTPSDMDEGATPSHAVAIAPHPSTLQKMVSGGKWKWLPPGRSVEWTDDRIDLLATFGTVSSQ